MRSTLPTFITIESSCLAFFLKILEPEAIYMSSSLYDSEFHLSYPLLQS